MAGPRGLPTLEKVHMVTLRPGTPPPTELATRGPSEQGGLAPTLPHCSFIPASGSGTPRMVAVDHGCGADGEPL